MGQGSETIPAVGPVDFVLIFQFNPRFIETSRANLIYSEFYTGSRAQNQQDIEKRKGYKDTIFITWVHIAIYGQRIRGRSSSGGELDIKTLPVSQVAGHLGSQMVRMKPSRGHGRVVRPTTSHTT